MKEDNFFIPVEYLNPDIIHPHEERVKIITTVNIDKEDSFYLPTNICNDSQLEITHATDSKPPYCLHVFNILAWNSNQRRIGELYKDDIDKRNNEFAEYTRYTESFCLDKSKTIQLSKAHRDYAQITDNILLIGRGAQFIIINEVNFQQYQNDLWSYLNIWI